MFLLFYYNDITKIFNYFPNPNQSLAMGLTSQSNENSINIHAAPTVYPAEDVSDQDNHEW